MHICSSMYIINFNSMPLGLSIIGVKQIDEIVTVVEGMDLRIYQINV